MSDELPPLGNKAPDRVASALRAVASAVPMAGGLLSEIITEVIPNQRMERVEQFLVALSKRVEDLGAQDRYPTKEGSKLELLEAGIRSAAATSSAEKIQYLANCVANGINNAESDAIKNQRIVKTISELDAEEMIVLLSYTKRTIADSREFQEKYPHIFGLPALVIGANQDTRKKHASFEAAKSQLVSLGLLNDEIEFDRDTGMAKQWAGQTRKRSELTLFGRLVLFQAGLTENL